MAHADDETKTMIFESAFDPTSGSVSLRVVDAVATFYEVESTDLDPLYPVIDLDALDPVRPNPGRSESEGRSHVPVRERGSFSDGTIRLSDPE
ncbi:HalOD1 output domain-containing protein [Natronosalvus amylolyticus]|uniref:HalOD1 output domain-containing protein n=1 Tax=Natronosalvus amylolyticus TaxID=2961994 RepID=UPI0020CA1BBB|nr:HalOD1 output domain-containing protein [Natronosalvus amylolyticus]